jgi:serralysin
VGLIVNNQYYGDWISAGSDPDNPEDDVYAETNDDTVGHYVEAYGSAGNDELGTYWTTSATALYGGVGKDRLVFASFLPGDPTASGSMYGGDGSGNLLGATQADNLYGDFDDDYIQGGTSNAATGADFIDGGEGADALYGYDGNDTIYGGDGDDQGGPIVGVLNNAIPQTFVNSQPRGLYGGDGTDWLDGNNGNDLLDGGTGFDTLVGGLGNDTFRVDNAGDQVFEDRGSFAGHLGVDTVLASASFALSTYAEVEVLTSNATGLSLTGSEFANTITGDAGNNVLTGNGDNDTLVGLLGNDRLYGGNGNDGLKGDAGADRLYGNAGKDTLSGGSRKDIFVFNATPNKLTNVDKITDFSTASDTFYLEKVGSYGKLKSDAFHLGKRAADAEDRVIYDKRTGNLYYDADGTGKSAAIKLAVLSNKATLKLADFFVI